MTAIFATPTLHRIAVGLVLTCSAAFAGCGGDETPAKAQPAQTPAKLSESPYKVT